MVRYKLMFKEKGKKRYYNFGPTIKSTANIKYNKIDSMKKAETIKKELCKDFPYRKWKIKKK